jgi:hypothetical protein
MSYDRQQPPQQQGEYDKGKEHCDPPPPPPPCPDPCDDKPPWGPPEIRPECCQHHPCCPEGEQHCCTWDSVDDPCVKAASADCGLAWTKITCNCSSSNPDCKCDEWDCKCYPEGTCVPCKPCEGLFPDPEDPGGCEEPPPGDCTTDNLRRQLDSLDQCISSEQSAITKLQADIDARNDRKKALNDLITNLDPLVTDYKGKRHTLICREDCLKGFHRDITTVFRNYSPAYLADLTKYINQQLCRLAQEQCCQKNLEEKLGTNADGKPTKFTTLIWEQQQAQKEKDRADLAFNTIKTLPAWLDTQFKELETLKDQIAQALNDVDPQKHKWAFYLFYWKFVPKLCRCFPYPFCCERDKGYEQQPPQQQYNKDYEQQPPQQQYNKASEQHPRYENPPDYKPMDHLGCEPGDWHPSNITDETLRALICCAWEYSLKQGQALQEATHRVTEATNNLKSIKTRADADAQSLDDRIKSGLNNVGKSAPMSR